MLDVGTAVFISHSITVRAHLGPECPNTFKPSDQDWCFKDWQYQQNHIRKLHSDSKVKKLVTMSNSMASIIAVTGSVMLNRGGDGILGQQLQTRLPASAVFEENFF